MTVKYGSMEELLAAISASPVAEAEQPVVKAEQPVVEAKPVHKVTDLIADLMGLDEDQTAEYYANGGSSSIGPDTERAWADEDCKFWNSWSGLF